jgi:hypothetical protein
MTMFPQVIVAPGGAVSADDVDFSVRTTQLDQQIMQQVELLQVIGLYIAGAVVAEKMVQLGDTVGQVLIADAVNHIDMLAGMQVIEAQAVGSRAVVHGAAREYGQERKENKQLSDYRALR